MSLVTLAQLREACRERADMVNSTFIENPELDSIINRSINSLYGLITSKFGEDYFVTESSPIPLVSGQVEYDLPADFFKLLGVDLEQGGGNRVNLKRFTFNQRNRNLNTLNHIYADYRYRLQGDKVALSPRPTSGSSIVLWYIPLPPKLVLVDDTFNGFNGWEEWVILDAAIKMRIKEETSVEELVRERMLIDNRIQAEADNRDASEPSYVQDLESYDQRRGVRWP